MKSNEIWAKLKFDSFRMSSTLHIIFLLSGISFSFKHILRTEYEISTHAQTEMRSIEVLSFTVTPFVAFGKKNKPNSGIEYKLLESVAEAMHIDLRYEEAAIINGSHIPETW